MSRIPLIDRNATTPAAPAAARPDPRRLRRHPQHVPCRRPFAGRTQEPVGFVRRAGRRRTRRALGEQIAVAVANRNQCHYCLAAHTALGRKAGLGVDTLRLAQQGQSEDPRTQAALTFALRLVDEHLAASVPDRMGNSILRPSSMVRVATRFFWPSSCFIQFPI